MTLPEFRVWFQAMALVSPGLPTAPQWEELKVKVAELETDAEAERRQFDILYRRSDNAWR
jgi:hypothetical protein